jgi:hypothetical protein
MKSFSGGGLASMANGLSKYNQEETIKPVLYQKENYR